MRKPEARGGRGKRDVSLSSELHLVLRAVDGVRLLSEKWRDGCFNREELSRLAPALHGIAVLARERLSLLDRAVRDTLDPRYLSCDENEALEALATDDPDVVLRAWSATKTATKLRQQAEEATRRAEKMTERRRRREEGG